MKVHAVVLTYEAYKYRRTGLLDETVMSLRWRNPYLTISIVDNSSQDGTELLANRYVEEGLVDHVLALKEGKDGNHTGAHGNNIAAFWAKNHNADLIVLSDDDVFWMPGWLPKLVSFWEAAPDDIKLAGCILEPEEYTWAKIIGQPVEIGGQRALIRASAGAASWTFLAKNYEHLFPVPDATQGGHDLNACTELSKKGYHLAQLDLALHQGNGRSVWGNDLPEYKYPPLNRTKWGFEK